MTRYCVARNTVLLRSREQRVFTSPCVYTAPIKSHCPARLMRPRSLSAACPYPGWAPSRCSLQWNAHEPSGRNVWYLPKTLPSGPQCFYEAPTCLNSSTFPVVWGLCLYFSGWLSRVRSSVVRTLYREKKKKTLWQQLFNVGTLCACAFFFFLLFHWKKNQQVRVWNPLPAAWFLGINISKQTNRFVRNVESDCRRFPGSLM